MKKLTNAILLPIFVISCMSLQSCDDKGPKYTPIYNENGDIKMQDSNINLVGKKYSEIIPDLQEMGFKNFKVKFVDDLIMQLFHSEGEIKEIYVNDKLEFINGSYVPNLSVVYIEVHGNRTDYEFYTSAIDGKAPAFFGSHDLDDVNRTTAINYLRKKQISNYKTTPVHDCLLSSSSRYDCVESLQIGDNKNFQYYEFFDIGSEYNIFYHDLILN